MAELLRGFDLLECVNCGLCLEVCPTYELRRDEASGPRGRIQLMALLADAETRRPDWAPHLEACVGCLACQARCPAGAPYGAMFDVAQQRLRACGDGPGRLGDWALEHWIAAPRRLRRWSWLLRLLIVLRLPRLLIALRAHALPGLAWLRGLGWLPRRLPRAASPPPPRDGAPHLFFPGCVGGVLFPGEESASLRLLDAAGGYRLPADWTCCGAMHRHLGDLEGACALARRNIAALEGEALVVTQTAGCGAALKDYGHWLADDPDWAGRAAAFSARVRDLSEVLAPERLAGAALAAPLRVAYDDPCHAVHAQGLGAEARALLDAVAGLERVEMAHPERCCGAGGTYFLRQPELSREMIAAKRDALRASGARLLLTANTGCRLQWAAALAEGGDDVEVRHPAELLAESLDAAGPSRS